TAETGAGLMLSPAGERILDDPEALRRLAEGHAVTPGDRGGVVREAVRRTPRPLVVRLLLIANLAVFAWGAWLASRSDRQSLSDYLAIWPRDYSVLKMVHRIGAVQAPDLIRGEWWRLLACCFVHFGILHVGMNMYMLHAMGRYVEQMWGPGRFLLIYLLSGLGGSVLAMTMQAPRDDPWPAGHPRPRPRRA